ncbi:MAG: taurine ABC transporter substrate-binding protein [Rhodobacteraceae bacterium]|nr:MAG: taurine ABC transporter substrate-binding protein [Paracoccaceae bacterium]
MKHLRFFTLGLLFIFSSAQAQETLQIGYFNEWPLPAHYGQISGAYDEVLGADTQWNGYNSSTAMFAALETGNIQIALSQGLVPFLVVSTAGLNFKIVDIAVSYPDNEKCFVHPDLQFSAGNTGVLNNATVALAVGTTAHFNLNRTLTNFGIDPAGVEMLNMAPAQAAAALTQGKVDIACGWGPSLTTLQDFGTVLLSPEQKTKIGIKNYDVIVIRSDFGTENPVVVAKFLKVTNELNASYTANPTRMILNIAAPLDMFEDTVKASMQGFEFPTITEKLGEDWLGGGVQTHLKQLADFFVLQGTMNKTLDNYADTVDPTYLQTAAILPLIEAE